MGQTSDTLLFREVQPLHQNLIIRVLLPLESLVTAAVVLPLALGPAKHQQTTLLLVFVVAGILLPASLMMLRLVTEVTERRIRIKFLPFPGREIDPATITSVEAIKYNPLGDAGGWGWRGSRKFHRVLNVSGDRGVHIRWGAGRTDQILVGSRRPEAFAEAVDLARFAASGQTP
jgi:hypothetical protein